MMSHMSYRTAFKNFKGLDKLDLSTVNTAVEVLKTNPSLSTRVLRPLLKNSLPASTHISGQHVDNFRRRVALYHLKNKDAPMVTAEQGRSLTKKSNLDKSEYIGMNDPIIQSNLNDMYAKIVQEDSNTWSAIKVLKECKDTIDGLDYGVLYSVRGIPTALLYMTARMRYCLLRYGNITF